MQDNFRDVSCTSPMKPKPKCKELLTEAGLLRFFSKLLHNSSAGERKQHRQAQGKFTILKTKLVKNIREDFRDEGSLTMTFYMDFIAVRSSHTTNSYFDQ